MHASSQLFCILAQLEDLYLTIAYN